MRKKKLIIPVLVTAAAVLVTAGLVSAYFADAGSRENKVYVGDSVIEISEDFEPPVEQQTGDNIFKKEISVVNHGTAPCYIRVYADFSDSETRARSSFSNDGSSFYSASRDLSDPESYVSRLSQLAPGWEFIPDSGALPLAGYYYYKTPVMPGQSTSSLFSYIRTRVEDPDQIIQYDVNVYAESCQTTDLNGSSYTSYSEAWSGYLSRSAQPAP